jgi:hypothetical protein
MPGERAQNYTITYNGYATGGSSGRPIHGVHVREVGAVVARVSWDWIFRGFATEDLLNAAVETADAAFRTPRKDLKVENGTGTQKLYQHAEATGFDADPIFRKVGDPEFDSSWSQRIHCEVAVGLPADKFTTPGLRTNDLNVEYDPARRRVVTLSGTVTALPAPGATTARDQYEDMKAGMITGAMAFLGIDTYDLMGEPETRQNSTDKTLDFRIILRENFHSEGGLGDDPEIVGADLNIYVIETAPGDTAPARRLADIGCDFSCWINKELTTDLVAKWESILPGLIAEAGNAYSLGPLGLHRVERRFDWMGNRIVAHLEFWGVASDVLENRVTTRDYIVTGEVLDPAWVEGEARAKYRYQGEMKIQRFITRTALVTGGSFGGVSGNANGVGVGFGQGFGGGAFFNGRGPGQGGIVIGGGGGGGGGGDPAAPGEPPAPDQANGCSVSPQTIDSSVTPLRKGVSGYSFDVTEIQLITMKEYYIPISAPSSTVNSGRAGQAG